MVKHQQLNSGVNNKQPWLGCIADDYTGATDLASFLVASGLRTIQINGVPTAAQLNKIRDVDVVVIALKSRTMAVEKAVELSVKSLHCLQQLGCGKFYFKYCSTFDSTAKGNIGPVIDALMAQLNIQSTVVYPALPVNGRTVYQGHLFVFDQLLSDSPMKNHPLTPMHDASVVRMIEQQGCGKAGLIALPIVDQGEQALPLIIEKLALAAKEYNYLVLDAVKNEHLATYGGALANFTLITGGSGLALNLSQEFVQLGGVKSNAKDIVKAIDAPAIVLSGSCSAMTQVQVKNYAKHHPTYQLDVSKLAKPEKNTDEMMTNIVNDTVNEIMAWLIPNIEQAPLISATASPEQVLINQQLLGKELAAKMVEDIFSAVAIESVKLNVRNIIVAGGETSGAVVNALAIDEFIIGDTITPGVPMVQTLAKQPLNLALKSGNFGDENFFINAVEKLTCV